MPVIQELHVDGGASVNAVLAPESIQNENTHTSWRVQQQCPVIEVSTCCESSWSPTFAD